MKNLYASPFKVYLALLLIALFGIWMGTHLPVSLFPNSSKPKIYMGISYGGMGVDDFRNTYGRILEPRLEALTDKNLKVEKIEADYQSSSVRYNLEFSWGNEPEEALKQTDIAVHSASAAFPREIRDSVWVEMNSENSGFFAASFYSDTRSLDELYKLLEPKFTPRYPKVPDAKYVELWNPTRKKVVVELDPIRLASLQLLPRQVENAIQQRTAGYSAGSLQIGDQNLPIEVRKPNDQIDDLSFIRINTPLGKPVLLGDIAKIDYRISDDQGQRLKTNGATSLMLYAEPKPGGNVKQMSEDLIRIIEEVKPSLPPDVKFKVLVDPSEFIRGAIENVFHEVLIGSLLAVGILFLFIGSLKNVITAAIEIPLSMVLAFILMRMTGMNLNLISLGGLALASGMNVDASVVVMENIFKHLEHDEAPKDYAGKLALIIKAVNEVKLAVIASTIASLVVFAPLAFTSALSYAVLGDLAKTVIFSHGFSAFVALLLVPTVRLHFLSQSKDPKKEIGHSPIESKIQAAEGLYHRVLEGFIVARKKQVVLVVSVFVALLFLVGLVLPRLPKEVLGTPDTDWITLNVNTQGNTLMKQMEGQTEQVEARLMQKFGTRIQYTFTSIRRPNQSRIMARLKDKREMKKIWKELENEFKDDGIMRFRIEPWNPAELPLPNPPDLKVVVEGGLPLERRDAANSIRDALQEKKVLPKIWTEPSSEKEKSIVLKPYAQIQTSVDPGDLADLLRIATEGKPVHYMNVDQMYARIDLRFPTGYLSNSEELGSFPVGVDGKILPLRALSQVNIEEQPPLVHRENGRDLFTVIGRQQSSSDKTSDESHLKLAGSILEEWKAKHILNPALSVSLEDAQVEINDAIRQLSVAMGLSIVLIFFTLLFQLGNIKNSLIVLAAIPLGFVGVLTSLFVFQSTLSLNSVLGVILLNGIAVGNSIILVDFTETLFKRGYSAKNAVLEGARQRLRPIFITSLTTVLGMLPVAAGFGQGGRVLQPLGIAVSGGLWVSMSLTLFLVPALQYRVLLNRELARADANLVSGKVLKVWMGMLRKKPAVISGKLPEAQTFLAPELNPDRDDSSVDLLQ